MLSRADGAERIVDGSHAVRLSSRRRCTPNDWGSPLSFPSSPTSLKMPSVLRIWVSYSAANQQVQARADLRR